MAARIALIRDVSLRDVARGRAPTQSKCGADVESMPIFSRAAVAALRPFQGFSLRKRRNSPWRYAHCVGYISPLQVRASARARVVLCLYHLFRDSAMRRLQKISLSHGPPIAPSARSILEMPPLPRGSAMALSCGRAALIAARGNCDFATIEQRIHFEETASRFERAASSTRHRKPATRMFRTRPNLPPGLWFGAVRHADRGSIPPECSRRAEREERTCRSPEWTISRF